ncbi:MAG TPA: BatA domain-containing protein [Pirellulales bacterium]|nr:BatA domain-containing protein [Pirellulales bacterium]
MSFLQPWLLAALPLVAVPLIIHLVNQRRFQTIEWAAMMFLLAARRMARGYSRLRQWLIMLARMGAIAALVLAVSRPLASGVLGLAAGGRADTTIILLDRSPSMQERSTSGQSKLETGRGQLVRALQTLRSDRWVLIDSATCQPRELASPSALESAPETGPASAPADIPAMLQEAYRYIQENHTGQTEIWICSDLRSNDWAAESNRWSTLRNAFLEMPQGVRFHLLAYPKASKANVSVRVTDARRLETDDGAELLVSLKLSRAEGVEEKVTLPVQFEIEGARSVVPVELSSPLTELKDHQIPLERSRTRGWGKISIPADANPADDDYYFVFDRPPPRRAVLVCEDPRVERPLALATAIAPEPGLDCSGQSLDASQLAGVDWDQTALLIWQAPLPTGAVAASVQAFVDRGGQVVFFPPANPGNEELFGVRWTDWVTDPDHVPIETWRSDEDVLARTLNGAALPVGQLEVMRYCGLSGETTALATLRGGAALVARAPTKRGGVYFWATTPSPVDSSLATSGVVLYAFVQRLLAAGAEVLAQVRQLDAGAADGENAASWARIADTDQGLSTEMIYHRGVYRDGDRLLAINRPVAEDDAKVLADEQVGELFHGLNYARVDDEAGSVGSLVQEIWRAFLGTMLVALVVEAALCLPKVAHAAPAPGVMAKTAAPGGGAPR